MEGQSSALLALNAVNWENSNPDVATLSRINVPGVTGFWTGLGIIGEELGTTTVTVTAITADYREVRETVVVTVVPYVSSPFDYEADIVVVGLGSAGTFAALAPAKVWPGVRVIALEADFQTANALARSMGGGHGGSVPVNHGGRINFTTSGPLFNADGSVSVSRGNMAFSPTVLPFNTIGANPDVTVGGVTRPRFVITDGVLPKVDTLREAVAHSNWLRTVFMQQLGLFDAIGTGMTWAAAGHGFGGLHGQFRFEQMWTDPANTHLTRHVTRMMRTRGEELIFDAGRIVGVRASVLNDNGTVARTIEIGADKVILATGNFLRDHDLIARYAEPFVNNENLRRFAEGGWLTSGAARMNEGFGHRMAISAGVAPYPEQNFGFSGSYFCESFMWRLPSTPANDLQGVFMQRHFMTTPQFTMAAASGGLIAVNGSGLRFQNETGPFDANMGGGLNLLANNNFPYHIIVSSDANSALGWNSTQNWNHGGVQRTASVMAALNAAADLSDQVEVLRADTLAELATLMGKTGEAHANFLATVNAYQSAIAGGTPDPQFADRAANLRVRQFRDGLTGDGPFFAIKIYPSTSMGHGGVAANWRGRALRTWDDPNSYIDNLYVVGEASFRGLYQPTYVAGSGIGWSWARGTIAGMDAAFRLRWNSEVPSLQVR